MSDDTDEKEKEVGKKKKAVHLKSKVKVCCEVLHIYVYVDAHHRGRLPVVRKMWRRPRSVSMLSLKDWYVLSCLVALND